MTRQKNTETATGSERVAPGPGSPRPLLGPQADSTLRVHWSSSASLSGDMWSLLCCLPPRFPESDMKRRAFLHRSLAATVATGTSRILPSAAAMSPAEAEPAPAGRRIDAHVHVLDEAGPLGPFATMGQHGQLLRLMDANGVDKAIMLPYVSPRTPDNNEHCASLARQHPDRLATLTDVRLHEADATAQVAGARELHGAAGISYDPQKPGLAWLTATDKEPLWEAYRANDLVCNLQITPEDYPVVLELCQRYGDIRFVLNHLGLPGGLAAGDSNYGGLLLGAAYPNLFVKASGFYACAAAAWDLQDARALGFLRQLVHGLGADRILWGSDWPPVGWHLTYRQALEIVHSAADLGEQERALIIGNNAAQVYRV